MPMALGWRQTAIVAASLVLLGSTSLVRANWRQAECCSHCCPVCLPCCGPTEYCNGDRDGNLKLLICDEHRNRLQVFFRHEYRTDVFAHHCHLNCIGDVDFPASRDDYTTFSLRYDSKTVPRVNFAIYGVATPLAKNLVKITNDSSEVNKTLLPRTYFVATDPQFSVCVKWISTQVVKIGHGPNQQKSIVLRFDPNNEGEWISLDGTSIVGP